MPEYLDVYDVHRNLTGKTILRGSSRGRDEYILVVHLLLFDRQGRLLVQQRVANKRTWGGMWDISLGGTAQAGDSSRSAIERETQEELGLTLDFSDDEPVFQFRAGNVFDDYWMATVDSEQVTLHLQKEEVAAARWVTRTEWEEMLAARMVIPYSFQYMLFDLYEKGFPGTRVFPFGNPEVIRGAVFDMDGLLLDTERLADKAWVQAGAEFHLSDPMAAIHACRGLNETSTKAYFVEHCSPDFDYEGFRSRARALIHEVTDVEVPVKEGTADILTMLHDRGIRLAVASSTREVTVKDQLSRAGLLHFFDAVITGDMVTEGKPAPDIYKMACDAIGIPTRECLAFEDSVNGIRSAYRAGTFPVQIPDVEQPGTESNALSWKTFASLTDACQFLSGYLKKP